MLNERYRWAMQLAEMITTAAAIACLGGTECAPDPALHAISITTAPLAIEPDPTWCDTDDMPAAEIGAKY